MIIFLLILIVIELAFITSLFIWAIVLPLQEKKQLKKLQELRRSWEKETK